MLFYFPLKKLNIYKLFGPVLSQDLTFDFTRKTQNPLLGLTSYEHQQPPAT